MMHFALLDARCGRALRAAVSIFGVLGFSLGATIAAPIRPIRPETPASLLQTRSELYVGTFLYFYSQSGLQAFGWPVPLTSPAQLPAFSTPCCMGPPLAIGPAGEFYATSGSGVNVFAPGSATQVRSFAYQMPGFRYTFFTSLAVDHRGDTYAGYLSFKDASKKPNRSGVFAFSRSASGITKPRAGFCNASDAGLGIYGLAVTSTGSVACIDVVGRVRTFAGAATKPRQIRSFKSPAEHAPFALADDPAALELYVVNQSTASAPTQIEVFAEDASGAPAPRRTIGLAGSYSVYDATVSGDDLYLGACLGSSPVILAVRKSLGGIVAPRIVLPAVPYWICDSQEISPAVGVRIGPVYPAVSPARPPTDMNRR